MKLLKWIIKMAKKILNLDTDNGEQSWQDATGGLPSGTVNQTLRHNGTEWVANSVIESLDRGDGYTCGFNMNITDGGFGYHYAPVYSIRYEFLHAPTGSNTIDNMTLDRESLTLSKETTSLDGNYTYGTMRIVSDEIFIDTYSSELDSNKSVKINTNEITHCSLIGTTSSLLEATADGTIQRSSTVLPTRTEYLSGLLSGTEHTFTGTTLGITGDLRSRIKNIKCFAVDSNGDFNGALIANEIIYETDLVVNSATYLSGSFSIKLFIEYV